MWEQLKHHISQGDKRALARCISLVENEFAGFEDFLGSLSIPEIPVIGITGPPGAGKSTLTDGLIEEITTREEKVAILCVDPSSPFNLGAVLGDRIRMSEWYNHPGVFIRSLATRGALGGLHPKIIELTDLLKFAGFDYVIVETVGVGQSEIEIAGLADVTVVTVVPEAGDEVQTMKAGLMEIADIFVVNKADRPGADSFINNLRLMFAPAFKNHQRTIPILKTIAQSKEGIPDLFEAIKEQLAKPEFNERKIWLFAERAFQMIQRRKMNEIKKEQLYNEIGKEGTAFNLYRYVRKFE